MRATQCSCTSSLAHRLSRTVIGQARVAAANREAGTIGLLNAVLNRIGHGLRAGAERRLPEALLEGPDELRAWLDMQAPPSGPATDVVIDAALFGDGTIDR